MIVWFNCKISDIRLNPQPRYHLRNDNRFDIARYSFASYAPLAHLVSKFIFNLEMADGYSGMEPDMEAWLRKVLPEDKLDLNWFRCNNKQQWEVARAKINDIDDDLVYPAGNEDHIFLDSSTKVFEENLNLIKTDTNAGAVFMTSHWSESIRAATYFNGVRKGNSIYYHTFNNDAIRVMKKELFNFYVDNIYDPNMLVFRTEHWNNILLPENIMYVPSKEQFRHFDGYSHAGIGPEFAPPLEIPPGFFEGNVIVKYGFNERSDRCVNINPLAPTLYAADGKGTDYKWCLEDIPPFWNARVIIADNIQIDRMKQERDINLLLMSRINFVWAHYGLIFDEAYYPPTDLINQHMLAITWIDNPEINFIGNS